MSGAKSSMLSRRGQRVKHCQQNSNSDDDENSDGDEEYDDDNDDDDDKHDLNIDQQIVLTAK